MTILSDIVNNKNKKYSISKRHPNVTFCPPKFVENKK